AALVAARMCLKEPEERLDQALGVCSHRVWSAASAKMSSLPALSVTALADRMVPAGESCVWPADVSCQSELSVGMSATVLGTIRSSRRSNLRDAVRRARAGLP